MNIFLSYASADKSTAESITFSLRSRGYKVFLDRDDLPAGESFDQRIGRAVKDADIFVFLISPDSVAEGHYTLTELTFARRKWSNPSGHVLPVMARETPLGHIPSYLKAVTILQPIGSITAETSAAVDDMRQDSYTPFNILRFPAELFGLSQLRSPKLRVAILVVAAVAVFSLATLWLFSEPDPQPPAGRSLWVADKSYVYLETMGDKRQFRLLRPSNVLSAQGGKRDSLLFDGRNINDESYVGKMFVYAGRRCQPREYDASGPITNSSMTVTLTGKAPQIDPESCLPIGEQERTLIFNFIRR